MTAKSAGGRAGAPLPVVLAGLLPALLLAGAAPGRAQQAGPVSPDSADRIRAAMERPPGSPPFDAYDAIALPFRALTFPVFLVGSGLKELGAFLFRPGRPPSRLVLALRDVREWGADPGFTSFGPRSGPGVEVAVDRFDPFYLRTGISWRGSQRHRAGLRLVREGDAGLATEVLFRRYAEPHFWGIGPDTRPDAVLDYRWDHVETSLGGDLRAGALGLRAGAALEHNVVGRGSDDDVPDLPAAALADTLFGVGERTRFARLEGSVDLDLTHSLLVQRRGVRARLGAAAFLGIDGTDAGFLRWTGELHGYLPLDVRQQLALRGVVELVGARAGRGAPFTHLPSLGSDRGLRGFDRDRFRDLEMVFAQAEWRYEIWRDIHHRSRVESFVFLDLGSVAPRLADLPGLESSYGFGMRALTVEAGLLGLFYVGFGEETRLSLDFSWAY